MQNSKNEYDFYRIELLTMTEARNSTKLYIYFLNKEEDRKIYQEESTFVLADGDITTQQDYAHNMLAFLLFFSPTNRIYVIPKDELQGYHLLFSWEEIKDLTLDLWFEYHTVRDRWGYVILPVVDILLPYEFQKFLHITMDRMDRYILEDWLKTTKQEHPIEFASILSPRITDRMKALRKQTNLWKHAQHLLSSDADK